MNEKQGKNAKYWQKRNEKLFLDGERKGLNVAEAIKSNYDLAIRRITSEIYMFYNEYAKEGKMELSDAKKLLNRDQLKTFKKDLKEFLKYAKENDFINDEKNNLKLMQVKTRISRLEELRTRIGFELDKLTAENESELTDYLADTYTEGYYRTIYNVDKQIGFAIDFTGLNKNVIEKAIKTNYSGVNYSNAIWQNKTNLMNILEKQIPLGLTLGYNPKKLAVIVDKKLNTGFNNTVRLMRTEYNLLLNQSTSDGYKTCGIEQYQILATLDNRTSEICQEMDGKVFDLKDETVGINYPPFHPNCRTTTIPYFEPDEIDEEFGIGTRLAKDENGNYYNVPANMTYKQWKEEYSINDNIF